MLGQVDPDVIRGLDRIADLLIDLLEEQKHTNHLLQRVGVTIAKGNHGPERNPANTP